MFRILIYLLSIVIANVVTAKFAPLELGLFIIPYGTLFIGLTLVMRDMVQNRFGRGKTYMLIVAALAISAITSHLLGDALWVVFASTISFIISETVDTEIYTRFKLPFVKRVMYSGIIAGFLDSSIFVIIGIGPVRSQVRTLGACSVRDCGTVDCENAYAADRSRGNQAFCYEIRHL